jgi:predicted CoA-binding protein
MSFKFELPKTILVVGASRDRQKYGNRAVRAYRDAGSEVLALNPHATTIEGAPAFKSVADLPAGKTTIATIYTPAAVTSQLLPELAAYGIKTLFLNPGADTPELVEQATTLGMQPLLACSVRAIGKDPDEYAP